MKSRFFSGKVYWMVQYRKPHLRVHYYINKITNTFLILLSHARHLPSLDEKMVDTVQEPFSFFDELTHLRKHGLESPVFAKVVSHPSQFGLGQS